MKINIPNEQKYSWLPLKDILHDLEDTIIKIIESLYFWDIYHVDYPTKFLIDKVRALNARIQESRNLLLHEILKCSFRNEEGLSQTVSVLDCSADILVLKDFEGIDLWDRFSEDIVENVLHSRTALKLIIVCLNVMSFFISERKMNWFSYEIIYKWASCRI